MHSDIEDVIALTCEFGDDKSQIGRQLLPRLRANLGQSAKLWTCTMIGRELAKRFRVEHIANREQMFHGLAISRNR